MVGVKGDFKFYVLDNRTLDRINVDIGTNDDNKNKISYLDLCLISSIKKDFVFYFPYQTKNTYFLFLSSELHNRLKGI